MFQAVLHGLEVPGAAEERPQLRESGEHSGSEAGHLRHQTSERLLGCEEEGDNIRLRRLLQRKEGEEAGTETRQFSSSREH